MFQLKGCGKCGGDLTMDGGDLRCVQCGSRWFPAWLDTNQPLPTAHRNSEGGRHRESPNGRRGRPKLNLTDEERLERKRASDREYRREHAPEQREKHREAYNSYHREYYHAKKAEMAQRQRVPKKCDMLGCQNQGERNFQIAPGTNVWLCLPCLDQEMLRTGRLRL